MKKIGTKPRKVKTIKAALKLLRTVRRGSGDWHDALRKLRNLVLDTLKNAKNEKRCMKVLASIPISVYDGEFRGAAVARMLLLNTFNAYKCSYIIAKAGSGSERRALEGMFATAHTVEELETVVRLAPDANRCKSEARARIEEIRQRL